MSLLMPRSFSEQAIAGSSVSEKPVCRKLSCRELRLSEVWGIEATRPLALGASLRKSSQLGALSDATSAPQNQATPAQSCGSRRDVLVEAKHVSRVGLVLQRDQPLVLLRPVGRADPILPLPHLVVDVDTAG